MPDLSDPQNVALWQKMEFAKQRLFYSLLRLKLPLMTRAEDPEGLGFDFLTHDPETGGNVMTGHDRGLITIALAEADDAEREKRRAELGEPYRTLLGHMRHEVGHYYWDRLVAGGQESQCGWLKDRYGLSWQVVPDRLIELTTDSDPAKAAAATKAMLGMRKIMIAELEDAVAAAGV